MEYLFICSTALLASGLTLFSGFGLGILLLPAFALFFPMPVAVGMTAIVHFLSNFFKLALFYKHTDWKVVLKFGVPAILAALVGARLLIQISNLPPLAHYTLGGRIFLVQPVKLSIAILLVFFALWEIRPFFQKMAFSSDYLAIGGVLSGFFGGLSGQQGALRSAFLARAGLTPEGFIATGVLIACLVDVARIPVYGALLDWTRFRGLIPLLAAAVFSAFAGAYLGNKLVKKVTLKTIQWVVAVMLLVIALGIGVGIL